MSWTGFATDLTLNDVVGPPLADAGPPRFSAFAKPRADVYATEDMLPPGPGKFRRAAGKTVLLLLVAAGVVLTFVDKPAKPASGARAEPSTSPQVEQPKPAVAVKPALHAQTTKHEAKPQKKAKPATPEPEQDDSELDTGDMSIEKFRKLSGKT